MVETIYGIISDVHQNPTVVPLAIEVLKRNGATKLLVNGDIGGDYGSLENSQRYTASILDAIGKSSLESFVQPGSHETLLGYSPVIKYFAGNKGGKYSNIIDVLKVSKVEVEGRGHDLVFLPGSDFLCGGEYQIGSNEKIPTGDYVLTEKDMGAIDDLDVYIELFKRGIAKSAIHYTNMNDLRKYVRDPDKTIVICHVPRKFGNLKNCVDMAEFGEAMIDFVLDGKAINKGSVFPIGVAKKIFDRGYPIQVRKENRGNVNLGNIYEELDIRKAISGHFHESVHRAHDKKGNCVREGKFVDELFWNGSYLDELKAGILTIKDDCKVQYRNIDLRDYVKFC